VTHKNLLARCFLKQFLGVLTLLLTSQLYAFGFGRMVGVLHHDRIHRDQLVKLDFIEIPKETGDKDLMAIFTLHLGDFQSGEYISYHFDHIEVDPTTGAMLLDQANQEGSIIVTHFDGNTLQGTLRSNFIGIVGTLELHREIPAKPTAPVVQPLGGEYSGTCGDKINTLELYTYRSTEDTTKVGHPFADYEVRGNLGQIDPKSAYCRTRSCIKNSFFSGTYNFFHNELVLSGLKRGVSCDIIDGGLFCEGCRLTKIEPAIRPTPALVPPKALPEKIVFQKSSPESNANPETLTGEYTGYIHHEFLNQYQMASVNLIEVGATKNNQIQISALARVFFGKLDSLESISYRYDKTTVDLTKRSFVLRRPEADVDAILKVTQLENGVMRGEWYSLLFGRVGTFELRKGQIPALSPTQVNLGALTGIYVHNQSTFELKVGATKVPPNTENPFFPLSFTGNFTKGISIPNQAIRGGSYDFYTGRFALFNDTLRNFFGFRMGSDTLYIKRVFDIQEAFISAEGFEPYQRISSIQLNELSVLSGS
jgi:hypothetical protein